jgi:hypothetical protein
VADSTKKTWVTPSVRQFVGPEDIWNYYKDRASPEELDRLRTFLKDNCAFDPRWKEPHRRRA